jgi:hypothetical protein
MHSGDGLANLMVLQIQLFLEPLIDQLCFLTISGAG